LLPASNLAFRMVVYSFYIFDRHTECIFSKRWAPRPTSKSSRPHSDTSALSNGDGSGAGRKQLSTADDAKLIFGVVFSLRNMSRKIGGEDNKYVPQSIFS
jgi:hypothetical protein